jgi:transcriptional regulator GlxA family with amidase domain
VARNAFQQAQRAAEREEQREQQSHQHDDGFQHSATLRRPPGRPCPQTADNARSVTHCRPAGAGYPEIAPRDVGRVVHYMHANLAAPITLADLVRESCVAGRTLLQHFRDFKGVPPMRYLRDLRLRQVRTELQSGAATRVHETAVRWGFAHAGRFSVEYRLRFGESPSATLFRSRAGRC